MRNTLEATVNKLQQSIKNQEAERDKLKSALESSEIALKQSEASLSLDQMEVDNVGIELEFQRSKKYQDLNNTRFKHSRVLETMKVSFPLR